MSDPQGPPDLGGYPPWEHLPEPARSKIQSWVDRLMDFEDVEKQMDSHVARLQRERLAKEHDELAKETGWNIEYKMAEDVPRDMGR